MKFSATTLLIGAGLLFGAGYVTCCYNPGAAERVEQIQARADSLDVVAVRRDTVYLTRLLSARARTDTLLQRDTLVHRDTVQILVAMERAACDTALAAKDTTIAETRGVRDEALGEARSLARRGGSRVALSAVYVFGDREPVITGTARLARVLGLDLNVGLGWRP